MDRLSQPRTVLTLLIERYVVAALKGNHPPVIPDREARLLIGTSQHTERVVVEPEPDVQAVLVDALTTTPGMRRSPARPLTPQLPPALVNRHVKAGAPRR
jgi:hypothetical protein